MSVAAAVPVPPTAPLLRFEIVKLLAPWRTRLLLAVCLVAPAGFVVAASGQSSLPTDTVFGRWMHATGWAAPLVVLGFCSSWALPLLTSLVTADAFASEDRHGTWRHLLVTTRSPARVFAAKALAALGVLVLLLTALAVSGVVGGLAASGSRPLVGLDGHLLPAGRAAGTVALAWLAVLPPVLAYAALGLLGAVALPRSPLGLALPVVAALAFQVAQLLPLPVAVRLALPSHALVAWRGLFTAPAQGGALLLGEAVCLAWACCATVLARRLFRRRDFTDTTGGPGRAVALGLLPLAVLAVAVVGALALDLPPSAGISGPAVEQSLTTSFAHLYRLQARELGRPDVDEPSLHATAHCDKGGDRVADRGPGNDWRCLVTWRLPGISATGTATYQLDVAADGRYVADGDGPKEVNGSFTVRTRAGDAPNPLWQLDGQLDLLGTNSKGTP